VEQQETYEMHTVEWIKCGDGANWCPFDSVDLSGVKATGVYIIWHEGNPGRTVRVGQGGIAQRIREHRNDQKITKYRSSGTLRVTWAAVAVAQLDGVERYLADWLKPLVGDAYPDVAPVQVNSPWAA
jgi:hypothetical protein